MDDEEALQALAAATTAMATTAMAATVTAASATAASATIAGTNPTAGTEVGLARAVPACPGWDVTSLVDHLGRVHLWAAHCARFAEQPERYPHRDREQPIAPWYAATAARLVDTLAELPPDQRAWSFSDEPGTHRTGFWRRRQFHETAVHHVDALQALGLLGVRGPVADVPGLTAAHAADGVDEVLRVMLPRTLVRRSQEPPLAVVPVPAPVALLATDVDQAWTLRVSEGRAVVTQGVARDARACLSGPAIELYLALWRRADGSGITMEGDEALGRRLLAATLVP